MKQHIKSIDSVRTLCIFAVLLIHTTTRTLEAARFDLAGFPLTIFLNQISRFAVPLFFIISGFVLEISYDKSVGYLAFLKKRFSRIFVPYFFWSLIYCLFVYNQNHENFLQVLLKGNASYQLYFIPALCIFYILFPLLHEFYNFISNKFIFSLLLISQIWLLYKDYFVKPFLLSDPVHIAILAYFFFIIGIIAARYKDQILLSIRRWKYILFPATFFSGIYVFWEGYSRYLTTGNYFNFYSQWRPSTFIYTILIGLTFYYFFEKKLKFPLIQQLSKLSFLVFFIHIIILETTWSLIGENLFGSFIFDPLFFGLVVSISFLIAFILHKIPNLYKLVG